MSADKRDEVQTKPATILSGAKRTSEVTAVSQHEPTAATSLQPVYQGAGSQFCYHHSRLHVAMLQLQEQDGEGEYLANHRV